MDVKFASKLDISAEALVAYPGLRPPCSNMPVEDLIRSLLQSGEEFTDQRSSHFKLSISVNFKSQYKKSAPSFDLPFGTVMTKLKLFHVVERKMYHAQKTFEINCHL